MEIGKFWCVAVAACVALASGGLMAPMAAAQQEQEPAPAPWIRMASTSGCTFFLYDYDDPTGTWQKQSAWTWTGACVGGFTSGPGDLTAMMKSGAETYSSGYRGAMVGGYFNGRVEEIHNGKMLADYYWQTFEMGCGDAAQFVYCKPYAATTASTTPAPVSPIKTATPVAATTRVGEDASAILSALKVEDEDRVFAMLAELVQTGQINLAREAQLQLTQRFPNSPLVPMAVQLIAALSQPAPAGAATPGASVNNLAATLAPLTVENVKQILERELGFTTKNIADPGEAAIYEFNTQRDGITVPVSFSVSPNTKYVWAQVRLLTTAVPQPVSVAAMARVADIQPAMFWTRSNGLWLGMSMHNRGLTAVELREMIDTVLTGTVTTQDVWGR